MLTIVTSIAVGFMLGLIVGVLLVGDEGDDDDDIPF